MADDADDVRQKALQLLRLLNEDTAKGLTNVPVRPDEQMVADAGLWGIVAQSSTRQPYSGSWTKGRCS